MFMLTDTRQILKRLQMQNPFAENSEEARESFKQMETVEELESFQKRLSDGKEFDVMVRDNMFWFCAFNKLVLAQSYVLPFSARFVVKY